MQTRTSKAGPPDLGHSVHVDLDLRRHLDAGDEATVRGLGRVRFRWVDRNGNLTFIDARGAHRTVRPDRVVTIHRRQRLRP